MKQKCDREMEIWSRVVGYYRPIDSWNKGKQEEFKLRKPFSISKAIEKMKNIKDKPLSSFTV